MFHFSGLPAAERYIPVRLDRTMFEHFLRAEALRVSPYRSSAKRLRPFAKGVALKLIECGVPVGVVADELEIAECVLIRWMNAAKRAEVINVCVVVAYQKKRETGP